MDCTLQSFAVFGEPFPFLIHATFFPGLQLCTMRGELETLRAWDTVFSNIQKYRVLFLLVASYPSKVRHTLLRDHKQLAIVLQVMVS